MKALIASLSSALALWGSCQATTITFTLDELGGNSFEADFTVSNDTLGQAIEEFTIFFGVGLFENITTTAQPLDWDPIAFDPDPRIPDDGFADWFAFGQPISVGETLGGFRASFDYLGVDPLTELFFEIVNLDDFSTPLDSGFATLVIDDGNAIPVPAAAWLFLIGGLSILRLKHSHQY